ncbi:exopolysaccharide biosynthesis polyprenyl glycosylphosphotransferase [Faecalibacter macacae]|uniref:Exopolysaccharide biosynthesis polyprenyl glycosylphosphotransferase n=1 Tax=Faecalibacter macacae TaxID=1859289 RepID=A0A3L9MEP9_9FLAO|nr:exopolysaccharide biosynthesis polyprenyl glycosylphosphotransferase [Faecalibacter macacae]RLZ11570.1 exopolysaccharide biosynthesis polyprenyl glycosylphosphotransferase [Faecalibacter macacae]
MISFNKNRSIFKVSIFLLDLFIVFCLLITFIILQYKYYYPVKLDRLPYIYEIIQSHYKALILLLLSWIVISDYIKFYSFKKFYYIREIGKKVIYQIFFFTIIFFTISGLKSDDLLANRFILLIVLILFIYLIFSRLIINRYFKLKFSKGKNLTNVIFIGNNPNSLKLKKILIDRKEYGFCVKNIDITSDYFFQSILDLNIKRVFISQSGKIDYSFEMKLLDFCENNHISTIFIPYSIQDDLISLKVEYIDTIPIFKLKKYPLEKSENQLIKYLFDLVFSLIVCVFILSWLFPLISILIKLDSKGPIIFKQKRRGLSGEEFDCFKFRTMRNDGTNSIKATVVNDSRVTKIGNFLRKTSLDEFPQFFNVLKGDMSIVGPRPHMISQDVHYSEIIKKYNLRNYVKPGITGLAQVKGYRGAINSNKDMEDRIITDIFYVRNWSLLLDIQIIYQTVVLIFKGDENAI